MPSVHLPLLTNLTLTPTPTQTLTLTQTLILNPNRCPQELTASSNEMAGQMGAMQDAHAGLGAQHTRALEELDAARAALSAAQDARIAAEVCACV